jgi:Flp pilus assembly protein TadD
MVELRQPLKIGELQMSDENHIAELLREGVAAAKAGHKEEARQALMQLVELDEHNEQGWLWLSGVVESVEEQRICLENVVAINPENAHALSGLRWLEQQELDDAPEPEKCPRCEGPIPSSGRACPHCGLPLIVPCPACGQYVEVEETACHSCGETLGDFHQGAHYHLTMAEAYLSQRRSEWAEEAIGRAEAEAADEWQVLERAAALHERLGLRNRAIAALEQAISLAPDNAALYARLGSLYRNNSMSAEARVQYEKARELAGADPDILRGLAEVYLDDESMKSEGTALLRKVLQKRPKDAQAHLLMADALMKEMHVDQALNHYSQAYQLASPESEVGREAHSRLAELQAFLEQQAHRGQRRAVTSAGLRKRPGCVTIYAFLMALGGFFGCLGAIALGLMISSGRGAFEQALLDAEAMSLIDMSPLMGLTWALVAGGAVAGSINLLVAFGLLLMKNWARIAVIILQVLSIVGSLAQATTTILAVRELSSSVGVQTFPTAIIIGLLVGFFVQGYILFWFVANGDLFD